MIAFSKRPPSHDLSATDHDRFLELLPQIRHYARIAFRDLKGDAHDDAVQETVANAFVAFHALARRGKHDLAFSSVLTRYAVAQIRAGRRVGSRLSIRDVLSVHARRNKRFSVESLDLFDKAANGWREVLVEDRRTSVADQAAFRIDFPEWLRGLSRGKRGVAMFLAAGHSTSEAAQRFQLTPGRVSQIRRELLLSWHAFHNLGACEAAANDAI